LVTLKPLRFSLRGIWRKEKKSWVLRTNVKKKNFHFFIFIFYEFDLIFQNRYTGGDDELFELSDEFQTYSAHGVEDYHGTYHSYV
jgi:hypothetical protein